MNKLRGIYNFYSNTVNSPENFSIVFLTDTFIEIINCKKYFEFCLVSETDDIKRFRELVGLFSDGLGFLLDFPMFFSHNNALDAIDKKYRFCDRGDEVIDFEIVFHTMEFDYKAGHYIEIESPRTISYDFQDIEYFVSKLDSSDLLSTIVGHYLKSIDEPELFLILWYKAYELIKDTGAITKDEAKKYTRNANDCEIIHSRHHKQLSENSRPLTLKERNDCKEFLRNGIFRLSQIVK